MATVHFNPAVDFISAVARLAKSVMDSRVAAQRLEALPEFLREDFDRWREDLLRSPFPVKTSFRHLIRADFNMLNICFFVIIEFNITEVGELLDFLTHVEPKLLMKMICDYYGLLIRDSHIHMEGETISPATLRLLNSFFSSPERLRRETLELLQTCYRSTYSKLEAKLNKEAQDCLEVFVPKLEEDPAAFISAVGYGEYPKDAKMCLYYTFFIGHRAINFFDENHFYLIFGPMSTDVVEGERQWPEPLQVFKALSEEKRLEILRLCLQRPHYNRELASLLNLTPPTLSYHIDILMEVKLLSYSPSRSNRYYYLTNKDYLKTLLDVSCDKLIEGDLDKLA